MEDLSPSEIIILYRLYYEGVWDASVKEPDENQVAAFMRWLKNYDFQYMRLKYERELLTLFNIELDILEGI